MRSTHTTRLLLIDALPGRRPRAAALLNPQSRRPRDWTKPDGSGRADAGRGRHPRRPPSHAACGHRARAGKIRPKPKRAIDAVLRDGPAKRRRR